MTDVAHSAAIGILDWLHKAEADLVGATVVTFNGETGTVHAIKLDEHHGLCFTLEDTGQRSERFRPVSTIKHQG